MMILFFESDHTTESRLDTSEIFRIIPDALLGPETVAGSMRNSRIANRECRIAALRDPSFYEYLALADAIRDGRVRERKYAEEELHRRLRQANERPQS
jgi:hypothetical protein